jgi:hypothetical protein
VSVVIGVCVGCTCESGRCGRPVRWVAEAECAAWAWWGCTEVSFLCFRNLIALCLCSFGWQEPAGMIASLTVGFRYMLNCKLSIMRMMVMSRKFILLFSSSNVNRSVGATVLNSCSTSWMLVNWVSNTSSRSSTYL